MGTTQSATATTVQINKPFTKKIIVIGSGPAGMRFINEVLQRYPLADITVFNNEPFQPYNRVQLSALIAGDVSIDSVYQELPDTNKYKNFKHVICKVSTIDTEAKMINDANGVEHSYDELVIATGSRAHIPNIRGVDSKGVYSFRNLKDAEALYARTSSAKHIVVAGGGLLGIEAARALQRFNTQVTLIQQGPRLMNRQLDAKAAALLTEKIEALGIRVIVNTGLQEIHVDERVNAVTTRDKETIQCDTVLICAGISPNIELAREAGLKVGKGIVVDDQLKTSAENVTAIGECCEHAGLTYGLVSPGYEQAAIAADVICGGAAKYVGSIPISRLKVVNESVCSMGEVVDLLDRPRQKEITYHNKKENIYRKLTLLKGRLIGAVGFGDWDELRRVEEAYKQKRFFWFWQTLNFKLTGKLWIKGATDSIANWPDTTLICQCNNISKGVCANAIAEGAGSVAMVSKQTSAGTVCGSCKPLIEQLVEQSGVAVGERDKEKAWAPVLTGSLMAVFIAAIIAFMPSMAVSDTVQQPALLENIWNNKFWKQVTGFTLVGLTVIGLLMSLRKRIKNKNLAKKLGEFGYWRLLHVLLGVFAAGLLILHTGLHLGDNLNQMLMINFLLVLLMGSLAGAVIALSHKLKAKHATSVRTFWTWTHILVTWPLPILLGIHILSVYYY